LPTGGAQQLRRRILRVAVALVAVAVVAGGVWVVFFSQAFAAATVSVTGASVLTADQVTAAAQVPLGTPLARLDTAPIAARVKLLKPVADVTVTRVVPNKVKIAVTERAAVYAVSSGSGFDLVDASGVPYTAVSAVPQGLIVATINGDDARLRRDVATVITALPQTLRDRAVLISADTADSIVIELTGGAGGDLGERRELGAEVSSDRGAALGEGQRVRRELAEPSDHQRLT